MKHLLFTTCMLAGIVSLHAQNIGIGNPSPNANAKLDITATDKGLLIPRMDSTHRKAIPNTVGLLVYDSTNSSFWYNNGKTWLNMATAASAWSLTGNSGTDTSINFLGTTDNRPLIFKVNNQFNGKMGDGVLSMGQGAYSNTNNPNNMLLTAYGMFALVNNKNDPAIYTSGYNNTAIGALTLSNNTSGQGNTALGAVSLNSNTTGSGNTASGCFALQFSNGSNNSAFGASSVQYNQTGSNNTGMGVGSLGMNHKGNDNTAIGYTAAQSTGTSCNTAIGSGALKNNLDGSYNTAIGYNADFPSYNAQLSNTTAIGANAKVDASNKIRLGDAQVTVVESNGDFVKVSDGRFKYNVRENVGGLNFIMQLRPVTYNFDTQKQEDFSKGLLSPEQMDTHIIPATLTESNSISRTGFIAQEVASAAKKSGYDFDGVHIPVSGRQYYSLSYASFVVPLVKAIQEQQDIIADLKKKNELLQQQNASVLKRLDALEKK